MGQIYFIRNNNQRSGSIPLKITICILTVFSYSILNAISIFNIVKLEVIFQIINNNVILFISYIYDIIRDFGFFDLVIMFD